jgi:hypothetical protein
LAGNAQKADAREVKEFDDESVGLVGDAADGNVRVLRVPLWRPSLFRGVYGQVLY